MRFVAGCLVFAIIGAAYAADLPRLDPAKGVIFPASQADNLLHQCSRDVLGKVDGSWVPTEEQIHALEVGLPAVLGRANGGHHAKLGDTFRQYVGISKSGRKVIYVNAFPHWIFEEEARDQSFTHVAPRDWKRDAMVICDGGSDFFGVEFDPSTGGFSDFAFNGVG